MLWSKKGHRWETCVNSCVFSSLLSHFIRFIIYWQSYVSFLKHCKVFPVHSQGCFGFYKRHLDVEANTSCRSFCLYEVTAHIGSNMRLGGILFPPDWSVNTTVTVTCEQQCINEVVASSRATKKTWTNWENVYERVHVSACDLYKHWLWILLIILGILFYFFTTPLGGARDHIWIGS